MHIQDERRYKMINTTNNQPSFGATLKPKTQNAREMLLKAKDFLESNNNTQKAIVTVRGKGTQIERILLHTDKNFDAFEKMHQKTFLTEEEWEKETYENILKNSRTKEAFFDKEDKNATDANLPEIVAAIKASSEKNKTGSKLLNFFKSFIKA